MGAVDDGSDVPALVPDSASAACDELPTFSRSSGMVECLYRARNLWWILDCGYCAFGEEVTCDAGKLKGLNRWEPARYRVVLMMALVPSALVSA